MNALISVTFLAVLGLSNGQFASLCKKASGKYSVVNPYNCSSFIECDGHIGTELPCLDGKWFDAKLLICRSPSVAVCASSDIPNYVRDLCSGLPKNELVPGVECNKYYKCNGSNTTAFTCPNGQHYSRAYSTCMASLEAGCKALSTMCSDEYNGFAFASLACDQYYVCDRKLKPELKSCERGLYFSADQQKCTEPALSGCSNNGGSTPSPNGNCDNVPVPICDSNNSGAFYPHRKPDSFYLCFNTLRFELQCEPGLTFDTLLKYCVKYGANRVC
ncbi:uncharacterized protein LOC129941228 [Eupeodes corollae]|uniref:uncharacterized protein LOC129941228 n=1 Tax=Eupeodes corollae TaxID=290404 RepID=UPI0024912679|nr:uncharacterized protein LOC129941228 [Eupeodes corollae]